MAQQLADLVRTEFEPPPYGGFFILQTVVLASATLALHLGLTMLVATEMRPHSSGGIRPAIGPIAIPRTMTVSPGNSVILGGEIWVTVATGGPPMRGGISTRAPSSRLVAFDLQTGIPRETGITLSPSPLGLFVRNNQLWAVSEDVVSLIQDGQVVARYPKRSLNEPTKPFLYKDQLAVIDKNRNDVYSLLTWNEGEWTEVGKVQAPTAPSTSRWLIAELRVISDQDSFFLFFFDGRTISFHEGIVFVSDSDPASALNPENQVIPFAGTASTQYPNWKTTPITSPWGTTWDAAIINGELWAFCTTSSNNGATIQQFKMRDGAWTAAAPSFAAQVSSFSVAGGQSGYLVGNDLHLYVINGAQGIKLGVPDTRLTEYTQVFLGFLMWLGPYLIATSMLVLGTGWLMGRHRKPEYLYGKRTVIQASISRRGIARAIDTVVSVFPPAFWMVVAVTNEADFQTRHQVFGIPTSVPVLLFSIFAMWLGGILVLSYMEGRYGITPGKWLCGIRTLRTTLRPCGMIRSLARQLLIYADSLFLLTWLPGVLLIAFTKNWQRLGDLAADTVVIVNPAPNVTRGVSEGEHQSIA